MGDCEQSLLYPIVLRRPARNNDNQLPGLAREQCNVSSLLKAARYRACASRLKAARYRACASRHYVATASFALLQAVIPLTTFAMFRKPNCRRTLQAIDERYPPAQRTAVF